MTEMTSYQQLTQLQSEHANRIKALKTDLEECRIKRASLFDQIEELKQQAADLEKAAVSLEAQIAEQNTLYESLQLQSVFSALKSSYTSVIHAQDHWLALKRLQERQQELLAQDPELETDLRDYLSFEQDPDRVLEAVPASYHQGLLKAHEEKRQRLDSYLNLEAREQNLRYDSLVSLQLFVMEDPESAEVDWVLPFQDRDEGDTSDLDILHLVAEEVLKVLADLTKDPGWYFAELSVESWAGYMTLMALAECKATGQAAESTQALLQAQLSQIPLFRNMPIDVQVAELSRATWERGLAWHPVPLEAVETELLDQAEDHGPLAEICQGWYTDADLRSWERPLRVVADSLWNVQARRLRTMLMRMVAKGKVAHDSVEDSLLWQQLPEPHGEWLRTGLERLVEHGVLLEIGSSNGEDEGVTLNPGKLAEVQNLIKRDVTRFWAPIIGAEDPDAGDLGR